MAICVVTVNVPDYLFQDHGRYFCLSIYEFKNSGVVDNDNVFLTAVFKEDLDIGSWDYDQICECGRKVSAERGIPFIPGISMGNSIDKYFKHVFK